MAPSPTDPPAGGAGLAPLERAAPGARRSRERQEPWRFWINSYIMQGYITRMGAYGFAVYATLAWHMTRESRKRWPSLQDIADQIGCSRSTVERSIRQLRELGLIKTTPCIDPNGQKSNFFDFVTPEELREGEEDNGTDYAGDFPGTAPPRPRDGGAPSQGRRPPVPETAPSGEEDLEEVCENTAHTPFAPLSTPQTPPGALRSPLIDAWMATTLIRGRRARAEVREEIGAEAAELLRLGFAPAELLRSVEDPARDRSEYPRQWRARLLTAQIAAAQVEETPAERVARQAQEREREAAELLADTRPVPKLSGRQKRAAGE